MSKGFIFCLATVSLFILFGFNSKKLSDKSFASKVYPTKTPVINKPANVESISFDKTEIVFCCPLRRNTCTKDKEWMKVGITTTAKDEENEGLVYSYKISDGKIIGQGANVTWDLSGVREGVYTIEASVDDGCGFCGKTVKKSIEVKDVQGCDPPIICHCPDLLILAAVESIRAGETIIFTAVVKDKNINKLTYNWSISQGKIIEGQGSSVIKVKTTKKMANTSLTATFEIGSDPLCFCEPPVSETVAVKN